MRRRLVLASVAVTVAGLSAVPAVAKPNVPVPVGVGGNGNGGVCVYAFTWVPQCVDTGQIGSAVRTPSAPAPSPRQNRIFCPYFQDPTVQTVAHTVCTHTPH
ncbi:MAG TPA: hypothetical protein VFJ17_09600 [Mycobacteriales bacterium]|jgi:hypothetical protein|nr:hypothetical protein [Mycobacteriales bacterium]